MNRYNIEMLSFYFSVIWNILPPPKKIKVHAEKGSLRGVAESKNKKIAEGVFMPERESGG